MTQELVICRLGDVILKFFNQLKSFLNTSLIRHVTNSLEFQRMRSLDWPHRSDDGYGRQGGLREWIDRRLRIL